MLGRSNGQMLEIRGRLRIPLTKKLPSCNTRCASHWTSGTDNLKTCLDVDRQIPDETVGRRAPSSLQLPIYKSSPNSLVRSVNLIHVYMRNRKLQGIVDSAIKSLELPMILPFTRSMISQTEEEEKEDEIESSATTLFHAARSPDDYEHRYPKPPGHGGDCWTIAGMFNLENLHHRAIILVYLTIYSRASGTGNLKTSRPPQPRGKIPRSFRCPINSRGECWKRGLCRACNGPLDEKSLTCPSGGFGSRAGKRCSAANAIKNPVQVKV